MDKKIDVDELMERVADDKELILELFDIYNTDYVEKRKIIDEVIASNDAEQLRGVAHALKGASGNISAHSLRELYLKLEDLGKSGTTEGAAEILTEIDTDYEAVKADMEIIKQEFSG